MIDETGTSLPAATLFDGATGFPNPATDWIDQRELAELFGVSEKSACVLAKQGRLAEFEHGGPLAGRKKYSRTLVERALLRSWQAAVRRLEDPAEDSQNS